MAKTGRKTAGRRPHKSAGKRGAGNAGAGITLSGDQICLYGIHTVRAALENPKRQIYAIKCTQNAAERLQSSLKTRETFHKNNVAAGERSQLFALETVETRALDSLTGPAAVHQGAVAICDPLPTLDASELFHLADAKLLLVLDQITDPHNAGAILRSAVAMGADAVLTTHRKSAAETAVLAKTASGALDMIDIIELRNLSKAIGELNDMGFATIGLDSEGSDILETELEKARDRSIALVLGSEGRGLRQQTREACTALARLDIPGRIKSLNVSNAAALSLYMAAKAIHH